ATTEGLSPNAQQFEASLKDEFVKDDDWRSIRMVQYNGREYIQFSEEGGAGRLYTEGDIIAMGTRSKDYVRYEDSYNHGRWSYHKESGHSLDYQESWQYETLGESFYAAMQESGQPLDPDAFQRDLCQAAAVMELMIEKGEAGNVSKRVEEALDECY